MSRKMLVVLLLIFLPFQGQALVSPTQVTAWFDTFIAPYESTGKFDAFVFSYFNTNASSIQTAVRGRCYSLAGVDTGVPNPAVSLFRIGSVTKLFTATAIMQLYEKGRLHLEAPVVTYVPSLSSVITSNMTVTDTLRHTTGVDERVLNIYISGSAGIRENLVEASRALWTQQLVSPGSRVTYSNLALTIMGAVVESVSQKILSAYFEENIVKPLNLSILKFHNDLNGDFTNVCYPQSARKYEPYQVRTTSSGDIYTTLNDISKFLSAHLNNGSGLFQNPATAQLMHSRLYPKSFDGMAYMFQRQNFRNRTILSKDGGVFDFLCNAALYPDYNEGVFAASTVGSNKTDVFLEELIMFRFVSDNYNESTQAEFPFSVDYGAQLAPIHGIYVGTRSGQKSPLKLFYLFRNQYLQASRKLVMTMGVTYQAALNVPGLSSQQILLMANTSTSPDKKNQFMLVTFTDSSKTVVLQIEQFPDLNTLQPLDDWCNNVITVISLFAFAGLAQLMTAFGFSGICAYRLCKRRPLTAFHLMGLSLAIVCWMSIGFFISLGVTPYPLIFFGVQPGFIAVQVLAIIMSGLTLLWTLFMLGCWMKNDGCSNSQVVSRPSVTVNDDKVQSEKRVFCLFSLQSNSLSKSFLILWVMIIIFQVIGIPGYFALNLLSFTIW
jgi:CubicO group peptidase (beta-lactamase class C family)